MFEKMPALDPDNRAFWTGGRENTLRICRCPACNVYQHPPLPVCPRCGSTDVEFAPVSGDALVVSFSVNWQPWTPGQKVPFVLAMVELVEQQGLWLMTNIVECDVEQVVIGMPVVVKFIQEGNIWLPVFRPRGQS